ncbi:MAG: LacI family transcriptional regulator [Spirochaetes bacterium]|nr:LacI family transcriptional regulator [Spirochaetota bacterium]
MANIKDVAKKAGVSISTVSYAINNIPKVSAETKEKILRIAGELNYQPNFTAQSLKRQKTETIGLFTTDICSPYYLEVTRGIQDALIERKYDLIIANIYQGLRSTAYRLLRDRRVDGGIILGSSDIPYRVIEKIAQKKVPLVVTDRSPDEPKQENKFISKLLVDNFNGAMSVVNHLISLGYRKIGYLSGLRESYDNQKRLEGFRQALQAKKIPFYAKWFIEANFTENTAYSKTKEMIKTGDLPEAIFAANDEMAIGAMHALQNEGIKIPEEMAIVGFDDIHLAKLVKPALTTVWRDEYKMGRIAVDMIFDMLNEKDHKNVITMPTRIMVRESCGTKLKNKPNIL